jgi:ribosomal protein S18 acetylase RimI-like enzyme
VTDVLVEPTHDQVLEYCARDPIERVFLEDAARRGFGRFVGLAGGGGTLTALCHAGANLVPSGEGCEAFGGVAASSHARMIIGEERAVGAVWSAAAGRLPDPREDRPGQPVYAIREPPEPGQSGLRSATLDDLDVLVPACAAAHELELGIDPLGRDPEAFRWRTASQIEDGRSWLWLEDGVVLFKAEASAWTPQAVQIAQVWTDPEARRHGYATRGLRDLCRRLLRSTPVVTLFVRAENLPAIRLYDKVGMQKVLEYRSVLF